MLKQIVSSFLLLTRNTWMTPKDQRKKLSKKLISRVEEKQNIKTHYVHITKIVRKVAAYFVAHHQLFVPCSKILNRVSLDQKVIPNFNILLPSLNFDTTLLCINFNKKRLRAKCPH